MKKASFLFLFFMLLSIGYSAFYDHQVNGMGQPPQITVSPGEVVFIDLMGFDVLDFDIMYSLSNTNAQFVGGPFFSPEILGDSYLYSPQEIEVWGMPQFPEFYNGTIFTGLTILCSDSVMLTTNTGYTLQINVQTSNPCVQVSTDACGYSKVGNEIIYDITISNCGDVDLEVVSVIDSLLGDITAEVVGMGCAVLPAQGSCNFQVPYIVQPGDDTGEPGATLVNVVEINYSDPAGATWSAVDDAVVVLLHPSFTVDVECIEIVDSTALFEVTFCNTGDVDLVVDPLDPGILPFRLPVQVDSECFVFVVEEPVEIVCGATSASKTIESYAIFPSEYCELANIISPDPVSDTATCEVQTNPCFTVEKNCTSTGPLTEGDTATYEIIVTNCGDVPLVFIINDVSAEPPLVDVTVGPIQPGDSYNTTVLVTVPPCTEAGDFLLNNEVVVDGYCVDGTFVGTQHDSAMCSCECRETVSVVSPNGSEVLTAGSIYSIIWSSDGSIGNVLLEYSIDNGSTWKTITTISNTNSYSWLVPAENSDQCLVRISDASDHSVQDTSDGAFVIERLPVTFYVDDDAPDDPGGGDTGISDPNEDGSQAHPFDAIHEAIDAAVDGDTIIVLPGTYTGTGNRDISFLGKAITVQGTEPENSNVVDQTVVDCQGNINEPHRGFIFDSGETNASILEGVTVTGGYAETGAGIYISATSNPVIRKCLIYNNTAVRGGGIGGGQ